jgi:starch synthase
MAAGRPVVARPVGALPETVLPGETGVLVDDGAEGTGTAEGIARALASLLTDRPRARTMGEAGRRRVEEAFSPARFVADVERIYRAVVDDR